MVVETNPRDARRMDGLLDRLSNVLSGISGTAFPAAVLMATPEEIRIGEARDRQPYGSCPEPALGHQETAEMDGPARNHRRLTSFPVHHRAPASPRTQTPSPGPAPPSRRLDHHLEHRLWNRFPGTRKMSGNTPTGPTYRPPFVLDNPKHRQYVRPCVGPVAQVVEQLTFNQWVTGSNPVGLTNQHIEPLAKPAEDAIFRLKSTILFR